MIKGEIKMENKVKKHLYEHGGASVKLPSLLLLSFFLSSGYARIPSLAVDMSRRPLLMTVFLQQQGH